MIAMGNTAAILCSLGMYMYMHEYFADKYIIHVVIHVAQILYLTKWDWKLIT